MIVWQAVKRWCSSHHVPRWQMLAGGALVLLLNAGLTVWIQSREHQASIELAARQEVLNRMTEVRMIAVDFQTYAANYVSAVIAGKGLPKSEEALIENVMRQHSAIELSKSIYMPETISYAREYQSALAAFNSIIPKSNDVMRMGQFWQAASRVLVSRDAFLKALEDQALPAGT